MVFFLRVMAMGLKEIIFGGKMNKKETNRNEQGSENAQGKKIAASLVVFPGAATEPEDEEAFREEGIQLEQQGKYEEAFLKYEEAARMDDTPSMVRIAGMYLSGNFRPLGSSNQAELLLRGNPIFPWSLRTEKQPDYKSAFDWLMKAADLGDGLACETVGNMLCNGIGCYADLEDGISFLEKAVDRGQESARKYIDLYRPNGKVLTNEEYEACLAAFSKAAEAGDDNAYELYATLKSGTQKQLARLGHILIAAQKVQRKGFEVFRHSSTSSGIPLLPVASKRGRWCTFLRFNLDAWKEDRPLIAVSSDILNVQRPSQLLSHLHHAKTVGTAKYRSPAFGWLEEEKEAVLIRLGEPDSLSSEELKEIAASFFLHKQEYLGESIAFMVENGEKEYSFEVAGIKDEKLEVLWRYTIGGSDRVKAYFEPQLISAEITVER